MSGIDVDDYASSSVAAQDPETTPSTGKESLLSERKRSLILEAMKNSSFNPEERNLAVQSILRGVHDNDEDLSAASSSRNNNDKPAGGENSAEEDPVVGMFKKRSVVIKKIGEESESEPDDDVDDDDVEEEDSEIIFESSAEEEDEKDDKEVKIRASTAIGTITKQRWGGGLGGVVGPVSEAELEAQLDLELENQARLEEEQQRREAEFKALRAMEVERVRGKEEQRLILLQQKKQQQQDDQRRVQDETKRLREEQEMMEEGKRLMEERELQQWLERERTLRAREQQQQLEQEEEEHQMMITRGTIQRQVGVVQAGGESAQRGSSSHNMLSASQTLASRQGRNLNTTTSSSAGTRSAAISHAQQPPPTRPPTRYDGVDDDELNWRLDSYVSLSDFTIIVNRAYPGRYSPDFATTDVSGIDFVTDPTSSDGGIATTTTTTTTPKRDVYYVHKAMLAVGSRRSEWLGRRIRDAENSSLARGGDGSGGNPDGHSSEVNVHETVMLESAADAMSVVLDFCYYPDYPLEINVSNAVPLVYLGKRYKIRALLEQADNFVVENMVSTTAMHFLLDANLYHLDEILARAIDVTAANLAVTVDFDPIYKLPPDLFRRIILSKEMQCDSELLSLIVYSYCGERKLLANHVVYIRRL